MRSRQEEKLGLLKSYALYIFPSFMGYFKRLSVSILLYCIISVVKMIEV